MRPWRPVAVVSALASVAVLAACAGGPVTRSPEADGSPRTPRAPETSVGSTRHLDQARIDAHIADCPGAGGAAVPQGLPDVTLECLGGGSHVSMSGLRGPLVVNLWAQWCGPCRQEAPFLAEVAREAEGRVAFLGVIYTDPRPDRAVAFADEAGWRYPQVVDQDKQLQPGLRVAGPPMTIFVDASGRVVASHPGPFSSADQLRDTIEDSLGVRVG